MFKLRAAILPAYMGSYLGSEAPFAHVRARLNVGSRLNYPRFLFSPAWARLTDSRDLSPTKTIRLMTLGHSATLASNPMSMLHLAAQSTTLMVGHTV